MDKFDVDVLRLAVEEPKVGVREYARRLNVARGTAQARIDRLERSGVLVSWRPEIDPTAMGYDVLAYVHVTVLQGSIDATVQRLALVPEIMEANSLAGEADLLCRVV